MKNYFKNFALVLVFVAAVCAVLRACAGVAILIMWNFAVGIAAGAVLLAAVLAAIITLDNFPWEE